MRKLLVVMISARAFGLDLAAGTVMSIRLDTPVSSARSKPSEPVQATLIAPLMNGEQVLISAGAILSGKVLTAEKKCKVTKKPRLLLSFDRIRGARRDYPIHSKLLEIDNAREYVASDGSVQGHIPYSARPGKFELVMVAASRVHLIASAVAASTKVVLSRVRRPQIDFPAGVEMTIQLTRLARLDGAIISGSRVARRLDAAEGLEDLASKLPIRCTTPGGAPADVTNLLLVGDGDAIQEAFEAAQWSQADPYKFGTAMKSVLALLVHSSYRRAPVSKLLLNGRAPDLVFQKQTNTFRKRHHVRLWKLDQSWEGRPLWLGAATHDTGLKFSATSSFLFTHAVHPAIDRERDKILNDLEFTGRIEVSSLVYRPHLPPRMNHYTGDRFITDGAVAVMHMVD